MEHGTRGPGADIAEVLCENQQHAAMQNTIYLFHTLLALLYWYIEINHYMPPSTSTVIWYRPTKNPHFKPSFHHNAMIIAELRYSL